jgi:hypothetical protein
VHEPFAFKTDAEIRRPAMPLPLPVDSSRKSSLSIFYECSTRALDPKHEIGFFDAFKEKPSRARVR